MLVRLSMPETTSLRFYSWLFCSSDGLGILHWKGGLEERGSAVSAFLFSPVFSQLGQRATQIPNRLCLIVGNFFGCGLGVIFLERLRNHWG
jgi:hypothetical protein